jgi:hypothetical protein
VCLGCAVPFRGRLLCVSCASRALGTPEPPERVVPRPGAAAQLAVGVLLLVGLGATVPPWHRRGTLTGSFSAWNPAGHAVVFVAVVALVAATTLAGAAAVRRSGPGAVLGVGALALASAVSTTATLVPAPDFYAFTAAPFVSLGAAVAAAAAALLGRWLGPPIGRSPP